MEKVYSEIPDSAHYENSQQVSDKSSFIEELEDVVDDDLGPLVPA